MRNRILENYPEIQKLYKNTIIETIGDTPLLHLSYLTRDLPKEFEIWAKFEGVNPGGSIKDRPALQMLLDGLQSKALTPDKVILDSTSGNTGIGLSLVGNIFKIPVELVVPANASSERKSRMAAYGAKITFTSPMEGSDGALLKARELHKENPGKYFKPDQYANPSNPKAHFVSTGPEIWEQTQGRITHFIACLGTTGTIMGNGRFFKEKNKNIQVLAAEPNDAFHGLEGLKHMASSLKPEIYKPNELDGIIPVPTEPSYELAKRLAREEGIFSGQSSGASVWAALHLAHQLKEQGAKQAVIVCILPDSGEKYYSKGLWDNLNERSSNSF